MGGHHEHAFCWTSGGGDGELVDLRRWLVGPDGFRGQGLVPAQPGMGGESQQSGAAGVGQRKHGELLREPIETSDGVAPGG